MKIYPDTKVYIACAGNAHTGGVELLHQLGSCLRSMDIEAYMFYFPNTNNFNFDNPVDDFYRKYHVEYLTSGEAIEDYAHNVLIAGEGMTEHLYFCRHIQPVLWWLSADNFLICLSSHLEEYRRLITKSPLPKIFYFQNSPPNLEHWVQSEYARQFVSMNGVPSEKIHFVGDYLNHVFIDKAAKAPLSRKENIVVYNPKKGREITERLIGIAPDIDWRPIQNMTPDEVQTLLASAKIYIDFGFHPGRDRIPREAAISGCVVVTGRQGAAANDMDVNIPSDFKFDERQSKGEEVIAKIREILADYPSAYARQEEYRARIMDDERRFRQEVAAVVGLTAVQPRRHVAILQTPTQDGATLAQALALARCEYKPTFIVTAPGGEGEITGVHLKRYHHGSYLELIDGHCIEVIGQEDAKFLFRERRIDCFAISEGISEEQIRSLYKFYDEPFIAVKFSYS
ncbi:MAG: hypothetical protein IJ849_08535 [Selenomonadaceae bacterium]|nr:hypothetical protein [Selenomonadaceae bacterium]